MNLLQKVKTYKALCKNAYICTMCREPIGTFRNELSEREYGISGLCQKCQDEIFGDGTEEPVRKSSTFFWEVWRANRLHELWVEGYADILDQEEPIKYLDVITLEFRGQIYIVEA